MKPMSFYPYINYRIFIIFGAGILYKLLSAKRDVCENRRRDSPYDRKSNYTRACTVTPWHFESKNSLVKYMSYVTEYHLQSFLLLLPMARQPLVGQDLLITEASRSHSDTPHSIGLPSTSDQPDADLCLTTLTTDRHPCPRRDSNTKCQQASGRRPTP